MKHLVVIAFLLLLMVGFRSGSPAAAGGGPVVFAAYYPWYTPPPDPNGHWVEGHHWTPTPFGEYDSADPSVLAWHFGWLKYAGMQGVTYSWWGKDDAFQTDARLPGFLAAIPGSQHPNLQVAILHEKTQFGMTVQQVKGDIRYITRNYADHPNYVKNEYGKPIIVVYHGGNTGMIDVWKTAVQQTGNSVAVIMQVSQANPPPPAPLYSWWQYDPAGSYLNSAALPYSVSVSPGFWQENGQPPQPRLVRDSVAFAQALVDGQATGAPFLFVTTFNEWVEGTQIEPASDYTGGPNEFLDAARNSLPLIP